VSKVAVLLLLLALSLVACAAETTDSSGRGNAAGGQAADSADVDPPVPPGAAGNDGREDNASMCFAACQNVTFSCKSTDKGSAATFTAQLGFEMPGCKGTFAEGIVASESAATPNAVSIAIDCSTRKVCLGASPGADPSACGQATFSAFSFAFSPSAGPAAGSASPVVCTRE
jgi:hypothetical protein